MPTSYPDPSAVPLPATQCPLCGGPNDCAPAACGRFDVTCWCRDATLSPEVLARSPTRLACVCAACGSDAFERGENRRA